MLLDDISPIVQTIAWPVIVYLVWDLKHNHLKHIYDTLERISTNLAKLEGRQEEEDARMARRR